MITSKLAGMREVPWETRNLNVPSFELDIDSLVSWNGRSLKSALVAEIGKRYFVQARVPANSPGQTSIIESLGFRTAELAIHPWIDLSKAKLYREYLGTPETFYPMLTTDKGIRFEVVGVADIDEGTRLSIINGAIESFSADRFHTDPNCAAGIADARIGMWLERDLLCDPLLKCTSGFVGDELFGFMICKQGEFILGGVTPEFIGKGFAKALYLESMKNVNEESNELSSTISANNIEVLNLYSRLGFSFQNPTYIFHLWGDNDSHE